MMFEQVKLNVLLDVDFEYRSEEWQLEEFMTIDWVVIIDDKVYYGYYVDDCDLSPRGVGAGAYDKRVIEIDLEGNRKRIYAESTVGEGPETVSSGEYFNQIIEDDFHDEVNAGYDVDFVKDYCWIFTFEYGIKTGIIAKIPNPKPRKDIFYDGRLLEEFEKDYWYGGYVIELKNYLCVDISIWTTLGWREVIDTTQIYFLKKMEAQ